MEGAMIVLRMMVIKGIMMALRLIIEGIMVVLRLMVIEVIMMAIRVMNH